MIDFSFTETKTNTENILKTETIYKSKFQKKKLHKTTTRKITTTEI